MPAEQPSSESIATAAEAIRRRIDAAGGDRDAVRLIAVTKKHGAATAAAAFHAGLTDLGENYASELVEKATELRDLAIRWHFLGSIQTNKINRLAPVTSCFQGVSRLKEVEAIAERAPGACIMVQADFTELEGRGGAPQAEVPSLVRAARSLELSVCGLMTVAPVGEALARPAFRRLREMADDLGLKERSMGMTDDLEVAVQEGSTMVRVGRALFGERQQRT